LDFEIHLLGSENTSFESEIYFLGCILCKVVLENHKYSVSDIPFISTVSRFVNPTKKLLVSPPQMWHTHLGLVLIASIPPKNSPVTFSELLGTNAIALEIQLVYENSGDFLSLGWQRSLGPWNLSLVLSHSDSGLESEVSQFVVLARRKHTTLECGMDWYRSSVFST
jgi:hypothetical protein